MNQPRLFLTRSSIAMMILPWSRMQSEQDWKWASSCSKLSRPSRYCIPSFFVRCPHGSSMSTGLIKGAAFMMLDDSLCSKRMFHGRAEPFASIRKLHEFHVGSGSEPTQKRRPFSLRAVDDRLNSLCIPLRQVGFGSGSHQIRELRRYRGSP